MDCTKRKTTKGNSTIFDCLVNIIMVLFRNESIRLVWMVRQLYSLQLRCFR
jgi:hypothetical protein